MNIFLPYDGEFRESIRALDDRRLLKQILECSQLLTMALKEEKGEQINGYKNHPVYLHYKHNLDFLAGYGLMATEEYRIRFHKIHKCHFFFRWTLSDTTSIGGLKYPKVIPFYAEGQKGKPNCIRIEGDGVGMAFRDKLIRKWEQDKANGRPPKWTNRDVPKFYQEYLKGVKNDK